MAPKGRVYHNRIPYGKWLHIPSGEAEIRGSNTISSYSNGEEATAASEGPLREMMERLSVLHDQRADLSEDIMATISEGRAPNAHEDAHHHPGEMLG
jgi:hypothetical protein